MFSLLDEISRYLTPLMANIGALFIASWVMTTFTEYLTEPKHRVRWRSRVLIGLSFALCSIVAALIPIELAGGYLGDARGVPILLASAIVGPVATLFVTACAVVMRVLMGGEGVIGGIVIIFAFSLAGLGYWYRYRKNSLAERLQARRLVILSSLPMITTIPIAFLMPPEKQFEILTVLVPSMYLITVLGVTLFARLLLIHTSLYELKKSEEVITRANSDLQKELHNKDLIIGEVTQYLNENALVSYTDAEGVITYVNDIFCDVSGYKREELIGQTHRLLSSGHHSKEFWTEFWNTLKSGNSWHGIVKNKNKNGDFYWVQCTMAPRRDENGETIGYASIRVDITERILVERDLEHATKLVAIGELASGVAHEINNPLTICDGNIGKVQRRLGQLGVEDEEISQAIEKYDQGSLRIANIVRGLSSFSRLAGDEYSLINVIESVLQSVSFVEEMFAKDGIQITLDLAVEEAFIQGNSGRIQQVMMNLLTNSRDALKGREIKDIGVTVEAQQGRVLIMVKDSGCGMSAEVQERMFQNFFTTKKAGEGTGIGLSLTKTIVSDHKGSVSVKSREGEGTEFKLSFPQQESPARVTPLPSQKNREVGPIHARVLVVDDEEEIVDILAYYIQDIGVEVVQASSGPEALQKLSESSFTHIFTDMKMPGMNGKELIEHIRAMKLDTKVILITGGIHGEGKSELDAAVELADGLIHKPFDAIQVRNFLLANRAA